MQRRKNIRLLIILIVLLIGTSLTYWFAGSEQGLDIDRDMFAISNTMDISAVTIEGESAVQLRFEGINWLVNNSYEADPQRISVLFAILNQVKVRREVATTQLEEVNKLFDKKGVSVKLQNAGQTIHEFMIAGDDSKALSYIRTGDGQPYLVEIPGYRSYLAGIFELDLNGWRNPLVFDLNWANLAEVHVDYPGNLNDLSIAFDSRSLVLEGTTNTDSTRLGNFIDDISLLYVNDYLFTHEVDSLLVEESQALITIKDIASNTYSLQVFNQLPSKEYVVLIDSASYGLMEEALVRRVTKPKSFFIQNRPNQ